MIVRCYRNLLQAESELYKHFHNFISHILQKVHKKKKGKFFQISKEKRNLQFLSFHLPGNSIQGCS